MWTLTATIFPKVLFPLKLDVIRNVYFLFHARVERVLIASFLSSRYFYDDGLKSSSVTKRKGNGFVIGLMGHQSSMFKQRVPYMLMDQKEKGNVHS